MYWIYWFEGKSLLEYINLFSPDNYDKNDKMIKKLLS